MWIADLAPRYRVLLATTESFLVSHPANWSALDLAPFGVPVSPERRYPAASLRSLEVIDGLHRLDATTFGDQDMLMPRWVLLDCGALPGIVYGFGRRAGDLPDRLRAHYRVSDRNDAFVPLSMWVAIRAAEDGAWFGHNLSSANLIDGDAGLAGLGTLTKALGLRLSRARTQYGATQWQSASLPLHLRFGDLHLLSAFTPAHTHPETFCYRLDVDEARLASCLGAGFQRPRAEGDLVLDATDSAGLRALQDEIEAGARFRLVRVEEAKAGRRVHICRTSSGE